MIGFLFQNNFFIQHIKKKTRLLYQSVIFFLIFCNIFSFQSCLFYCLADALGMNFDHAKWEGWGDYEGMYLLGSLIIHGSFRLDISSSNGVMWWLTGFTLALI